MAAPQETRSMALFCDFENVALGVRDAKYAKFDINKVLERLLLKGSIVVKKAYCDWERYKEFKADMHGASFELIEIPHVRQSGKNSADIRMVVDALDLCYTKSHVDTFVIISGDSDFSPLVSKLRENNKTVIGVGVKNSTSDLLIANCDEFIYYDDLAREEEAKRRAAKKRKEARPVVVGVSKEAASGEDKKQEAMDLVLETIEALHAERGAEEKIWGSMVKQALKRRRPNFNESYYGYRTFSDLLEDAAKRKLIKIERDEKSGAYLLRLISKDTAFDSPIQDQKGDQKADIAKPKELNDVPVLKSVDTKTLQEKAAHVISNLVQRGASKPRTVKTLSSTITSLFKRELQGEDLDMVLAELQSMGAITITENKVSYTLPEVAA